MVNKYGGYSLRVIGTDQTIPNVQLPQTNSNAGLSAAGDVLRGSAQRLQGAAGALAEGAQVASQISGRMTENQIQANQASLQVAQSEVAASNQRIGRAGQATGQISQMLMNFYSEQQKQQAQRAEMEYRRQRDALSDAQAAAKIAMEQEALKDKSQKELVAKLTKYQETQALEEYNALYLDSQGIIHNNGNSELKDRLAKVNNKWRGRVSPEFLVDWNKLITAQADDEIDRQMGATYENIRQVNNLKTEDNKARFQLQTVGITTGISSGRLTVDDGIRQMNEQADKYIADNKLEGIDAARIRVLATQQLVDSGKLNFEQRNKVLAYQQNLNIAIAEANKLREEEAVRVISPEERHARLMDIANRTGIDIGHVQKLAPSPQELLQRDIQNAQLAEQMTELERKDMVTRANRIEFTDGVIGNAVGSLIQNFSPKVVENFLNQPDKKGVKFWESVRAAYGDYQDYVKTDRENETKISQLNQYKSSLRLRFEQMKANGAGESELIEGIKALARQNIDSLPEEMRPKIQASTEGKLDLQKAAEFMEAIEQETNNQIWTLQNETSEKRQQMSRYGLDDVFGVRSNGVSSLDAFRAKHKAQIDRYQQMSDSVMGGSGSTSTSGASSNFGNGSVRLQPKPSGIGLTKTSDGINHEPIKAHRQLQPVKFKGQTFASPFAPGTSVVVSDDYGGPGSEVHARRGRSHAGLDFAVAANTPIYSPTAGVVTNVRTQVHANGRGYGLYVDVKIPDGRIMRFAHLARAQVQIGDKISPGQLIAKSGDSGSPGSYHLHFEVRSGDPKHEFYYEGSSDPKLFLAQVKDGLITPMPRRNSDPVMTAGTRGASPPVDVPRVPANAVKLPFGQYIYGNQVYTPVSRQGTVQGDPEVTVVAPQSNQNITTLPFRNYFTNQKAVDAYNRAHPIPKQTVPSSVYTSNEKPDPNNNFGYKKVAENEELRRNINDFAQWLGVPASWVADIIHFESGHDDTAVNQFGCTGLFQFCGAQRDEFGGIHKIKNAGISGQFALMKRYVNKWGARGKIRTMGDFYVLMQRPALLKKSQQGDYSVYDMRDGNGGSIRDYVEKYIGREAGRRYRLPQSRRASAINHTHDTYYSGCRMCNQLVASNSSLIPHELELS